LIEEAAQALKVRVVLDNPVFHHHRRSIIDLGWL